MRISALIKELEGIKSEHGDILVSLYTDRGQIDCLVQAVTSEHISELYEELAQTLAEAGLDENMVVSIYAE